MRKDKTGLGRRERKVVNIRVRGEINVAGEPGVIPLNW